MKLKELKGKTFKAFLAGEALEEVNTSRELLERKKGRKYTNAQFLEYVAGVYIDEYNY